MAAKPQIKTLLNNLDYGFNVASWHGSNLMGVLRGITAGQASRRFAGRKCIWEQALHAAYWKQMVLNKVIGTTPFPRRGSNWPKMPAELTDSAWKDDLQLLRDIHTKLRAGVARLQSIDEKQQRMIIGAAFHDIYHAAQIKLLKRMLRE
jgi:hypothetical protein